MAKKRRGQFGVRIGGTALLMVGLLGLFPARAQVGSNRYASIVVDARSGAVLSQANADELRHPASLTKMMTLYMLFEALRDRRVTLDEPVPVSLHAASMSPTKLGLVPGSAITVEQGILGLITLSANDAAAALGELMGGDEDRFAQMMTLRARALGMTHSQFYNASGLPDPDQVTSARDMAILARHLVQDFPVEYRYFSTPSFVFHGRTILNHDHMLQTYPGADGLKTGFTNASGHNLVTSAVRNDTRLIGVVLGAASNGERDQHMAALLDRGFDADGVPVLMAHRDVPMRPSLMATARAETVDSGDADLPAAPPAQRHVAIHLAGLFASLHRHHGAGSVDAVASRRAAGHAVEVAEAPRGRRLPEPPVCVRTHAHHCGQVASR